MDEIVCYCKEISKKTIEKAIEQGARTLEQIKEQTGACTGTDCKTKNPSGKCCAGDILKLIEDKGYSKPRCSCCC